MFHFNCSLTVVNSVSVQTMLPCNCSNDNKNNTPIFIYLTFPEDTQKIPKADVYKRQSVSKGNGTSWVDSYTTK